jgi:hypothetical protein
MSTSIAINLRMQGYYVFNFFFLNYWLEKLKKQSPLSSATTGRFKSNAIEVANVFIAWKGIRQEEKKTLFDHILIGGGTLLKRGFCCKRKINHLGRAVLKHTCFKKTNIAQISLINYLWASFSIRELLLIFSSQSQ